MPKLTIVAHVTAAADQIDFVSAELKKLIEPTLAEAGCIQYDFHQDNDNPAHFMFYENWESRELWLDHMESEHLKAFKAATADTVVEILIYEMTGVNG